MVLPRWRGLAMSGRRGGASFGSRFRRDPSLMVFARDEAAGRNFTFGVGGADRLQQKVAEFGEGGGFLTGDAALREQSEDLGERAVHAGGRGEIARGGKEFGEIVGSAADMAFREGIAEKLFLAFGVIDAERGVNVGAGHGALASIGKHELAAVGQRAWEMRAVERIGVSVGVSLWQVDAGRNVIGAGGELVIVVLVRREIGRIEFGGILGGNRRRRDTIAFG
jgi:hypothetical protein